MDQIRESMRPLPGMLQPFLTWLTGMPLHDQQSLFQKRSWHFAVAAAGQLVGGAIGSYFAIRSGWWVLLPVTLIITIGGARMSFVTCSHQAIHGAFSRSRRVNRAVADVVGVWLLLPGHDAFHRLHAAGHHRHLAGDGDPDAELVLSIFKPGTPKPQLWRQLWKTLLSPSFHRQYLRDRVGSLFTGPGKWRRVCASLSLAAYIVAPAVDLAVLAIWHLPVIFAYQAVALVQLVGLHRWGRPGQANPRAYAEITLDRYAGTRAPGRGASVSRWAGWVAKMLLSYLPLRVAVFAGEIAAVHALHHALPCDRDWPNAIYRRREKLTALGCGDRRAYWGYVEAADAVFDDISRLPTRPLGEDRSPLITM